MSKKVLIVEDDRSTRFVVGELVESFGLTALMAGDGEEALLRGESEHPDVVVLDLGLPGMDGWETMRRLRQGECAAPVVVLSAREGADEVLRAFASGASYYVRKPYRADELLHGIRLALADAGRSTRSAELRNF